MGYRLILLLDPVAIANNVAQKLFGDTAKLDYNGNQDANRPPGQLWAALATSIFPLSIFRGNC